VHLGFIIAFEHVVFFFQCLNARLVPDVPALATKITREGYLAKQAVADNGEALPSVSNYASGQCLKACSGAGMRGFEFPGDLQTCIATLPCSLPPGLCTM
ncbi:hypothetical protein H8957_017645, partial [Semnopithecus entellus]